MNTPTPRDETDEQAAPAAGRDVHFTATIALPVAVTMPEPGEDVDQADETDEGEQA